MADLSLPEVCQLTCSQLCSQRRPRHRFATATTRRRQVSRDPAECCFYLHTHVFDGSVRPKYGSAARRKPAQVVRQAVWSGSPGLVFLRTGNVAFCLPSPVSFGTISPERTNDQSRC